MGSAHQKRRVPADGRMTRKNVIEHIGGCVFVPVCARNTVRNMRATAKQRGCEQTNRRISASLS